VAARATAGTILDNRIVTYWVLYTDEIMRGILVQEWLIASDDRDAARCGRGEDV
jgi:hypothetical protein